MERVQNALQNIMMEGMKHSVLRFAQFSEERKAMARPLNNAVARVEVLEDEGARAMPRENKEEGNSGVWPRRNGARRKQTVGD